MVYDYFEMGLTQYKGNVYTPADVVMDKLLKSYELWRTNIEADGCPLDDAKAIIDLAVTNKAMVHFYAHNSKYTQEYADKLQQIIDYAKENAEILPPTEACRKYYAYRANEDLTNS